MAGIYAGCFQVLRPGGLLVTVTRNLRRQGRVFHLASATVTLAEQAGYQYLQHVIALLAAVRDSALHARGRKYREPLVVPGAVPIWPGSMPADRRSGVVVRRPIVKPASPERREQAIEALAQLLVAWLERRASGTSEALPGGGRVLDSGPDPEGRP